MKKREDIEKEVASGVFDFLYDKDRDVQPVSQSGYVDLREAYANKALPSDFDGDIKDGDECEDPESIITRADDVFNQLHQAETIRNVANSDASD